MNKLYIEREVVEQALNNLEDLAFSWKAPNYYTPQIVMWAQGMRAALSAAVEPVKVCEGCLQPSHCRMYGCVQPAVSDAAKPEPCPDSRSDDYACKNRHQCWEPCGELGHSAEHARPAPKETQDAVNAALGLAVKPETFTRVDMTEPLEKLTRLTEEMGLYPWQEKPETQGERAELLGTLRGIATIIRMGEPERLKVNDYESILKAAALLAAPARVEPLTYEQMVALCPKELYGVSADAIGRLIRNVEVAHGIGKDQAS